MALMTNPLSACLFILCVEVLLVRIRNDSSVRGFKFDKIETKLTSFHVHCKRCKLNQTNTENNEEVWYLFLS